MPDSEILTIKSDTVCMRCLRFGRGKKNFIILPGLSLKSVLDSPEAIETAFSEFTEDYTVYLFDRRENPPADYPVAQMAADTAACMKQIGIKSADIFGASQGGMMAQYIAIGYPELVHRLVLGSTISRPNSSSSEVLNEWHTLAAENRTAELAESVISHCYSKATLSRYHDVLLGMYSSLTPEELKRFFIFSSAAFNTYDDLVKIQCPVLVIGSEGDRVVTADASREIAEKLNCRLFMYGPEYGHCVYDEAPDYRSRVLSFFRA